MSSALCFTAQRYAHMMHDAWNQIYDIFTCVCIPLQLLWRWSLCLYSNIT